MRENNMTITISINIEDTKAVVDTHNSEEIITPEITQNKPKKANRYRLHYAVDDEVIVYKICDAGLLDKLRGVNYIDGKRIYFFEKEDCIKEIIDKFSVSE